MKNSFNKPSPLQLIAAAVLVLATGGLYSVSTHAVDDKKMTAPKPALTVSTVSPSTAQVALQLSANGNVAAWQEASIGAEVSGLKLTDVRVNVGDVVRRGQVLATFGSEGLQADAAQARASVAEAQANAQEATANAARARELQNTGAMSAQQIAQLITFEATAKARVESAQAMLQSVQIRLKNTQLLAPDSGTISARSATLGAVVGQGAELFRMIRQNRLEWRAELTSAEVARIQKGQTASISAGTDTIKGKVRMVSPTVDANTRAAIVYVDVPLHPALKAGMYARGTFDLGASSALTLPAAALVQRDGYSLVMRVATTAGGSKVGAVKVQTGRRSGNAIEITSGLQASDVVVASGAAFLVDGDAVKIVNSPEKQGNAIVQSSSTAAK
jgi:HlyD family secretion protein